MAKRRSRGNGQGCVYRRGGQGAWIAQYYDYRGQRRERSTRTTDKQAAERVLSKWVADEALRRAGVIDPEQEAIARERNRPIQEHLADYESAVAGRWSDGHRTTVLPRIEKLIVEARLRVLGDLRPDAIDRALNALQDRLGLTDQTRNDYLTALKAFVNWLVRQGRLPHSPIAGVQRLSVPFREARRALTPDEAVRLIRAAQGGEAQRGLTRRGQALSRNGGDVPAEEVRWEMTGPARALLYRVAMETGLRRGALARLRAIDFDLGPEPTVTAHPAPRSKNPRKMVIPLRRDTADAVTTYATGRLPMTAMFDLPEEYETARMLRFDLEAARREWIAESEEAEERAHRANSAFLAAEDSEGRRVDFHALRTTCATWLDAAGVSPSEAIQITGHSNVNTLQRHYHRPGLERVREAVAALPRISDLPASAVTRSG